MATDKSPGIAAFLSFLLPGLGELYCRMPLRAIPFLLGELYFTSLFFSDFSAVPLRFNTLALFASIMVSVTSVIDAYFCAKQYNARHLLVCPRCGGKNQKGAPQCLLCWAPLSARGAPPAYLPARGPPPSPPGRP